MTGSRPSGRRTAGRWAHHHHAASFWPYRDLPNVLMVHYADLLADLEAQMRRVAAFTQLQVAEDAGPGPWWLLGSTP